MVSFQRLCGLIGMLCSCSTGVKFAVTSDGAPELPVDPEGGTSTAVGAHVGKAGTPNVEHTVPARPTLSESDGVADDIITTSAAVGGHLDKAGTPNVEHTVPTGSPLSEVDGVADDIITSDGAPELPVDPEGGTSTAVGAHVDKAGTPNVEHAVPTRPTLSEVDGVADDVLTTGNARTSPAAGAHVDKAGTPNVELTDDVITTGIVGQKQSTVNNGDESCVTDDKAKKLVRNALNAPVVTLVQQLWALSSAGKTGTAASESEVRVEEDAAWGPGGGSGIFLTVIGVILVLFGIMCLLNFIGACFFWRPYGYYKGKGKGWEDDW